MFVTPNLTLHVLQTDRSAGVFVGSGIFKSAHAAERAKAIVQATTHYKDAKVRQRGASCVAHSSWAYKAKARGGGGGCLARACANFCLCLCCFLFVCVLCLTARGS